MSHLDPAALFFGPAYLQSPLLQQLADAGGYPWRQQYLAPMQGQEALYGTVRDMLDLLHEMHTPQEEMQQAQERALALLQERLPGMEIPMPVWLTESERALAIARLAGLARAGLKNPYAAQALRELAATGEATPQKLLQSELFPWSVCHILVHAYEPRRLKIGATTIKDASGKWRPQAPATTLPTHAFVQWFRQQLSKTAELLLCDAQSPRLQRRRDAQSTQHNVEMPAPGQYAVPDPLFSDPAAIWEVQSLLTTLYEATNATQREILALRDQYKPEEIGALLGMSRSGVYKALKGLQDHARELRLFLR